MESGAVLDFLLTNGFHRTAAALREDLVANHDGSGQFGPECGDAESSSSSSSDIFLSMASSTSDLANPYFFYADSMKSPDAVSEFGTARDYRDEADANWFDWKDPYLAQVGGGEILGAEGDGDGFGGGPLDPVFDAWSEGKEVLGGERGGNVALGSVSWGKLLNELGSGEEIKNLDLRLNFPKLEAGGEDQAANADINRSSEFVESEKSNKEMQDHDISTVNGVDNDTEPLVLDNQDGEYDYEVFDLKIIHRKNRTGFEATKEIPVTLKMIIAGRYYITGYLGSAAFSKVFQANDRWTGEDVCLKIIKNNKDYFDQSLDEVKLLKLVNKHDPADKHHILRLYDYFYHQEHLFIVCELLKANLYVFQRYNEESNGERYFTLPRIQYIARQCLEGLAYLHSLGIIHCDLKPENILIKSYTRCEIKIIDLGNSCFTTDNLCSYVQSRSYRAPEVILGTPYDQKIDIWSLGCILSELYCGNVLFPNRPIAMLLGTVIGILGPIDMEMLNMGQETHKYFTNDFDLYHNDEKTGQVMYVIPRMSSLACFLGNPDPLFLDFLQFLLQINPQKRPTAAEALEHMWFSYQY